MAEKASFSGEHAGGIEQDGTDIRVNPATCQVSRRERRAGPTEVFGISVRRFEGAANRIVESMM
jgi:hypothetical protein